MQERERRGEVEQLRIVRDDLALARSRVDARDLELETMRRVHVRVGRIVGIELHVEELLEDERIYRRMNGH